MKLNIVIHERIQADPRLRCVTHPKKEHQGFQRIALNAGETRTVALEITPELLAFWNIDVRFVVKPGEFLVMVGPNSPDLQSTTLTVKA